MFTKTFRYFLLFTLFLLLGTTRCVKEDNPVPTTSINIRINDIESDPRYSALRISGNAVRLKTPDCVGYNCNGVVIFRYKNDGTYDDFKAYDITCTHEAKSCAMTIDTVFSDLLICPCCGSIFTLYGGYMQQGPAKFPLREYQCDFFEGDLRIY